MTECNKLAWVVGLLVKVSELHLCSICPHKQHCAKFTRQITTTQFIKQATVNLLQCYNNQELHGKMNGQ